MKKGVLFVCTANSCRSQIAKGLANSLWGDKMEAFSAGSKEEILREFRRVRDEIKTKLEEYFHSASG